jgi:hypothetical protein
MLYRLKAATMGIVKIEGCSIAVTIPIGTIITVHNPLPLSSSSPPIEVDCAGKTIRMFPTDILQRAEEIQHATRSAVAE